MKQKPLYPPSKRKVLAYDSKNLRISPNIIISRKDAGLTGKINVGDTVTESVYNHPKYRLAFKTKYTLKKTGKPHSPNANNSKAVWFGTNR